MVYNHTLKISKEYEDRKPKIRDKKPLRSIKISIKPILVFDFALLSIDSRSNLYIIMQRSHILRIITNIIYNNME
jgi:hypothetical protein